MLLALKGSTRLGDVSELKKFLPGIAASSRTRPVWAGKSTGDRFTPTAPPTAKPACGNAWRWCLLLTQWQRCRTSVANFPA